MVRPSDWTKEARRPTVMPSVMDPGDVSIALSMAANENGVREWR